MPAVAGVLVLVGGWAHSDASGEAYFNDVWRSVDSGGTRPGLACTPRGLHLCALLPCSAHGLPSARCALPSPGCGPGVRATAAVWTYAGSYGGGARASPAVAVLGSRLVLVGGGVSSDVYSSTDAGGERRAAAALPPALTPRLLLLRLLLLTMSLLLRPPMPLMLLLLLHRCRRCRCAFCWRGRLGC